MNMLTKVVLGLGLSFGLAVPAMAHDQDWRNQRDWRHAEQHQQLRDEHHEAHDALGYEHADAHAYELTRREHRQLHRNLRHQDRDEHRDLRREHGYGHDQDYYDRYGY